MMCARVTRNVSALMYAVGRLPDLVCTVTVHCVCSALMIPLLASPPYYKQRTALEYDVKQKEL